MVTSKKDGADTDGDRRTGDMVPEKNEKGSYRGGQERENDQGNAARVKKEVRKE